MKYRFLSLTKRSNTCLMSPGPPSVATSPQIIEPQLKFLEREHTHLRRPNYTKSQPASGIKSLRFPRVLIQEPTISQQTSTVKTQDGNDLFNEMKHRFLSFKKDKYLGNLTHYQNLAKIQTPKFLVIACADSRVCPSNILGFQPGEAFMVRNVANLVPPFENGPSETKAALEFSINTLEVENILVVGHSCCAGISALMSMPDQTDLSSFTNSWVITGKNAKLSTKAVASDLSFDLQCKHCEKVSINHSLSNLLSYPWIAERVSKGVLSIHGGYYDFVNCTFEKWQLDYQSNSPKNVSGRYAIRSREFWS
ncbi:beta carbonic anhydrase 5, chloroplastic-like isoform X1 [Daucus carota subsp. sativus]|uniref:beta carbonic anhydrase 5, chloroplastic-like isoform X1 n=1 Tax=Daucus carota subsp. sativus TaxID=79200 RepID=UPI0007EF1481|nr:PREDICTED: beta carbonic anhydrase 5, chloroplastic-like isoform X1 [Daucus carota subsp. sativus]